MCCCSETLACQEVAVGLYSDSVSTQRCRSETHTPHCSWVSFSSLPGSGVTRYSRCRSHSRHRPSLKAWAAGAHEMTHDGRGGLLEEWYDIKHCGTLTGLVWVQQGQVQALPEEYGRRTGRQTPSNGGLSFGHCSPPALLSHHLRQSSATVAPAAVTSVCLLAHKAPFPPANHHNLLHC